MTNAGTYMVTFSASVTGTDQVAIFLNGTPVAGSTYGTGAGGEQNTGQVLVVVPAGGILTLVNHTTPGAFALVTPTGGTQPTVNASVAIEKLQ